MPAKLIAGGVAAALAVAAFVGVYFWGKAVARQECAEERAQAIAEAVELQQASLRAQVERAKEREQEALQRRREAERRAQAREEELDDYLSSGRGDTPCLPDDALRLFNDGRSG